MQFSFLTVDNWNLSIRDIDLEVKDEERERDQFTIVSFHNKRDVDNVSEHFSKVF